MKKNLWNTYLTRYAADRPWKLRAGKLGNIEQVVVIPAYAEKDMIFTTLASLAANDEEALDKTLILCVINNKVSVPDGDQENNRQTLNILDALIEKKEIRNVDCSDNHRSELKMIAGSPIRLGLIDASTAGLEIPAGVGGVGMARKIGLDTALRLLHHSAAEPRLMISLDADTLVQSDYLTFIRRSMAESKTMSGIVSYAHQMPWNEIERNAICRYEIFLRYWVLGLQYAGSPYAFHTIGSTIVTTVDGYLAVRGMNRREAGEDFYFLNKLAKIGPVQHIRETKVYPSARISRRVPFGTGAAVDKILSGSKGNYPFYDPCVFVILKNWLDLMKQSYGCSEELILSKAKDIDPGLASFLVSREFMSVWSKIRRNVKDQGNWIKQFHGWFDGFETLKLINHLSSHDYPRINMSVALNAMMEWMIKRCHGDVVSQGNLQTNDLMTILSYLRDVMES